MDIYKITDNYLGVLRKYAVFNGRAPRTEYWWFVLANLIVSVAISIISKDLNNLYGILTFLPGLGVGVRRLHDVGKSGHFLWWLLLPIAGLIIVITKLAKKGHHGENKYGPIPATI